MNTVKNLHYLSGLLSQKKQNELEEGASLYRRRSNITFKILKTTKEELIVEVRQGENSLNEYLSLKELNERAKDLFSRFLPGYTIHTRPQPYNPPPVNEVTPKWVSDRMKWNKVGIKDLVRLTGIDKTNFSAWINGKRPMSQPVKAMFYFYFNGKD